MKAATDDRVTPAAADMAFWQAAEALFEELNRATEELATCSTVSAGVLAVVQRMVGTIADLSPAHFEGADPYLVEALLTGTVGCAAVAWFGEPGEQRRELRIPLERTRQALRDLLDERNTAADRPAKEVARWLAQVTDLPQHELASLLGVGTRTFQRWVSGAEAAAPTGDDEMRLRTLARTIDQLRWSMTAVGVVRWLSEPHPGLAGRKPVELLGEPGGYRELPRLAAATRALVAG